MTELLLYTAGGVFLALLMGVARGSMRRWVVGAGLALLVVFVAFPFSRARGFKPRYHRPHPAGPYARLPLASADSPGRARG